MTDRLRLRDGVLAWRRLETEVVALHLGREEYLRVNTSGAGLWRLLAAGTTRADLVRHLADAYGLDDVDAQEDTDSFLTDLDAKGLLERG